MGLKITSSAFKDGGMIPPEYTCDGSDLSPQLGWDSVPAGTKSFALICDDPDAPAGTWVHWVIFNMPGDVKGLSARIPPRDKLGNGASQGINDFGKVGYGGPCPPSGTHRYFFKLYALDTKLELSSGIKKAQLLTAIAGHILAEGRLVGKYKR